MVNYFDFRTFFIALTNVHKAFNKFVEKPLIIIYNILNRNFGLVEIPAFGFRKYMYRRDYLDRDFDKKDRR